jgi:NhaA family Na+:H+ antiporter
LDGRAAILRGQSDQKVVAVSDSTIGRSPLFAFIFDNSLLLLAGTVLAVVIPFMPHSAHDIGLFDPREDHRSDTLNRFEHWWAIPVQFVLLLFGFANAGVPFEEIGPGTYYVLAALLIGKPVGILLFAGGAKVLGASPPRGLHPRDLVIVGVTASIGFTVSLFFATAAFPAGSSLAETKMGALLSFAAAPLALLVARNRPPGAAG